MKYIFKKYGMNPILKLINDFYVVLQLSREQHDFTLSFFLKDIITILYNTSAPSCRECFEYGYIVESGQVIFFTLESFKYLKIYNFDIINSNTVATILTKSLQNLKDIYEYILDQQKLINLCIDCVHRNNFPREDLLRLPRDIRKLLGIHGLGHKKLATLCRESINNNKII